MRTSVATASASASVPRSSSPSAVARPERRAEFRGGAAACLGRFGHLGLDAHRRTDAASRMIAARLHRVFAALVDPEALPAGYHRTG